MVLDRCCRRVPTFDFHAWRCSCRSLRRARLSCRSGDREWQKIVVQLVRRRLVSRARRRCLTGPSSITRPVLAHRDRSWLQPFVAAVLYSLANTLMTSVPVSLSSNDRLPSGRRGTSASTTCQVSLRDPRARAWGGCIWSSGRWWCRCWWCRSSSRAAPSPTTSSCAPRRSRRSRRLILALEAKDRYTAGHAQRVATFCEYVGSELGFGPSRMERLRYAALMHDIGKLIVPNQLLNKPGRLTESEFARVRRHEGVSVELLRRIDFLAPIAGDTTTEAATAAVEGSGLVEPAIIHVADAFDAMTSTRSYRKALSQETAFAELRGGAGLAVQRRLRRGADPRDRGARRALRRRVRGRRPRVGRRTARGGYRIRRPRRRAARRAAGGHDRREGDDAADARRGRRSGEPRRPHRGAGRWGRGDRASAPTCRSRARSGRRSRSSAARSRAASSSSCGRPTGQHCRSRSRTWSCSPRRASVADAALVLLVALLATFLVRSEPTTAEGRLALLVERFAEGLAAVVVFQAVDRAFDEPDRPCQCARRARRRRHRADRRRRGRADGRARAACRSRCRAAPPISR